MNTAMNIVRDVSMFFGCHAFSDEAGNDLPHRIVSICKHGLLNIRQASNLWIVNASDLRSPQWSHKHRDDYLENGQRVLRSCGGLTTVLDIISRSLDYEIAARRETKGVQRKTARAKQDAALIEE